MDPGLQLVFWTKSGFKGMITPVARQVTWEPCKIVSSEEVIIAVQKTPVGILVHQSPLRARLYLFSLNPRILEVIIRKNAEPGRNNRAISDGNGGGHI
jgi:hypothetical protein